MSTAVKVILGAIAVLVLVFLGFSTLGGPKPVVQPIAYNHNIHVEGEGLECVDCHRYAEELPRATLPTLDVCTDCHDSEEALSDSSSQEALLMAHIESGVEVDWKRVYQVPDHVYFSHRRHVVAGELECASCHGDVGSLSTPAEKPFYPTTMAACISCHKKRKVTTDCIACHR